MDRDEAPSSSHDITALLGSWTGGDLQALDLLVPLVGEALRKIASRCLGRAPRDPMLTTSALVNEAYLRFIGHKKLSWRDRAHFFGLCARIIRGIVVDHARAHAAQKRGGGTLHVAVAADMASTEDRTGDIIAIDEALTALTEIDPRKGRLVELRFFGGLTVEETAEVLGVSEETVLRAWRLARMWLRSELTRPGSQLA